MSRISPEVLNQRTPEDGPEVAIGYENGDFIVIFGPGITTGEIISELNRVLLKELKGVKDASVAQLRRMGVDVQIGFSDDTGVVKEIRMGRQLIHELCIEPGEVYRLDYDEMSDMLILSPLDYYSDPGSVYSSLGGMLS